MEQHERTVHRSAKVTLGEFEGIERSGAHPLSRNTLVFVRSGLFGACDASQSSVIFDANYVLLAGEGDYLYPVQSSKDSCACTLFHYEDCDGNERPAIHARCVLSSSATHLKHVRLLNDAWLGKTGSIIDDGALEVLEQVLASTQTTTPPRHEHRYTVQAIKDLLNRSLGKPPALAEVARQFYMSPFTVSRIFRKETGISLRRYTNRLRLRKALHMMLCGPFALTDIAVELGFYDEPHFSKAFTAEFGMAPAFALGPLCSRSKQQPSTTSSNTVPSPLSAGR